MTDEQIKERIQTVTQVILNAREMIRSLDHHAADLQRALTVFRDHHAVDQSLRQREMAVLAREDRATVREREIDEALKKLQVGT